MFFSLSKRYIILRTTSIKPLSYRVSCLASLFASESDYESLALTNNGILFTGKSTQNNIPYLDIRLDITVGRGFFWDVLVIPLESGNTLRFSGVAKKQSKLYK